MESAQVENLEGIVKKEDEVERELEIRDRRDRGNNFANVCLNAEEGNERVKVEEFLERFGGRMKMNV